VHRRAEKALDEESGGLIGCYEITQRAKDCAIAKSIALLQKAGGGRRESDTLALESLEGVHLTLQSDVRFIGAEQLGARGGLALARLTIVRARGVELGGCHAEPRDRIDGGEGGFVALAPNDCIRVGELSALAVKGVGALGDLVQLAPGTFAFVVDAKRPIVRVA
jgi:hypothetical protein